MCVRRFSQNVNNMIQEVEYTLPTGEKAKAAYMTSRGAYDLGAQRERFAQRCAAGALPLEAYCEVYGVTLTPDTVEQIKAQCSLLIHDTTVVLRIQELKKPVLRKLRRKIEYGLEKALAQCEVAYDLAYNNGDVKGLLAAIRMQAELSKLLSQQIDVTHKYGLLDDADTETLLEMRRQIEVQRAKGKKLPILIAGKSETVGEGVDGPALVPSSRVPSEAVPN